MLREAGAFTEKAFDKGQAYNNALILAGFGGLFALLGATKTLMPKMALAAVALMTGISLLLFMAHVIVSMLLMSLHMLSSAKKQLANAAQFQMSIGVNTRDIQRTLKMLKIQIVVWIVVWAISVVTGLGAGATMLVYYVKSLLT